MASRIYFEFLNAAWDQLPEKDKERIAELWEGYEQIIAATYQKFLEINLNTAVADLQPWSTERWLNYAFNQDNFVSRPASYTSNQDLSVGMNLSSKYLLRISIDGGTPFEVNIQGYTPSITNLEEILRKINGAAGFKFAEAVNENTMIKLQSSTVGQNSSIQILVTSEPEKNACEFVLGIDPEDLPVTFPKFKYPYTIPYENVAAIPELRDSIRDENLTHLLEEETDYVIEQGGIVTFKEIPHEQMWAERTQVNTENPWFNYGYLTEIYQKNSPRYVGVIQGLWFALWNGPTPNNIKISLYMLFGLPTAAESGVVTSITTEQINILGTTGTLRSYPIPSGLESIVTVGESVKLFQPLVSGISVYDKVNSPGFVENEIGRVGIQRFLTENATRGTGNTDETKALRMLEEYTFLPQISVESFIYPDINLQNVTLFLDMLKPICKTYMFQVIVGSFKDLVGLTDRISGNIDIDLTSILDSNETTFMDQATLDAYESTSTPHSDTYDGLSLDPEVVILDDRLEIEVRRFGTLIDSFTG